ncbi:hypothetical protein SFRURICE_011894 [Spodoptera frugiperda]|nr:hypothetical protein SFRURICE_011894 [Spodoptera frugiperda]
MLQVQGKYSKCLKKACLVVCFTFKEIETRPRSALCLIGSFAPANQSAERALVSFSFNVKQTRTKGTVVECNKV